MNQKLNGLAIFLLLSIATSASAFTLIPQVLQSRQDGALIAAKAHGLAPRIKVSLYNLSAKPPKLIGAGMADDNGFLQFPSVLILNRDSIPGGEHMHAVTIRAEDSTGQFALTSLRLN